MKKWHMNIKAEIKIRSQAGKHQGVALEGVCGMKREGAKSYEDMRDRGRRA